jgi:hypothetical protein
MVAITIQCRLLGLAYSPVREACFASPRLQGNVVQIRKKTTLGLADQTSRFTSAFGAGSWSKVVNLMINAFHFTLGNRLTFEFFGCAVLGATHNLRQSPRRGPPSGNRRGFCLPLPYRLSRFPLGVHDPPVKAVKLLRLLPPCIPSEASCDLVRIVAPQQLVGHAVRLAALASVCARWLGPCPRRNHVFRRHGQVNRN